MKEQKNLLSNEQEILVTLREPQKNEFEKIQAFIGQCPPLESLIGKILDAESAIKIFQEGTVMSKGTTTSTGLVHSYFANVFGSPQYRDLHDKLAAKYFKQFFEKKIFVGKMRTRLGISGYERKGPKKLPRYFWISSGYPKGYF